MWDVATFYSRVIHLLYVTTLRRGSRRTPPVRCYGTMIRCVSRSTPTTNRRRRVSYIKVSYTLAQNLFPNGSALAAKLEVPLGAALLLAFVTAGVLENELETLWKGSALAAKLE